ncbi:hypothetical protein [Flexithrix dorotheae]|uniref:hypothetical protein n=1 Tax=Flexithrix dorotheae TaxID=70993 RepID=UPI00037FEBA0|nr:hypothetical protein [Flexithrix dorotheae]
MSARSHKTDYKNRKSLFLEINFLFILIVFSSCSDIKENPQAEISDDISKKSVKVIFDTDMGSDCDDVGALALLHQYANQYKAEIVGCIYSSGKIPYGAGVVDAINHYYNRPNIPIGAAFDTLVGDKVDKMSAEKLAKDTAAFGHTIVHNFDAIEQTVLNRQLLAEQEDNSIVYITIGHTKGLHDLLVSKPDSISPLSGEELITRKISHWVALGALGANNTEGDRKKDWNFFFNNTAQYTEYLVNNFPKPIYFVNGGSKVMTGKSLETTPKGNIVRQAYTDWLEWYDGKKLADQRPSWDLATVYFAIEGKGEYFEYEENGRLDFDANSGCVWKSTEEDFNQFYITQRPDTDMKFAEYLNKLIALPPEN